MSQDIASADGKLGILMPGLGAVATTLIAGVIAVRKGLSQPIGSLTQMGTIRLGKRTENRNPLRKRSKLGYLNDLILEIVL
ncbi:MAG: inositol-3-phosphate synthase [Pseudomonadales bacterium]|nr:inositol-3-phosphate synthase [Pseudomonadales bacterium]